MSAPAINIENLKFAYPNGPVILDIPVFKMDRGRHVFLMGPSGSGKTTLLGLIAGILDCSHQTASRLEVYGHDVLAMNRRQRDGFRGRHLGYIFQMFNLIPYLNVLDNITLPCRMNISRRENIGDGDLNKAAREIAAQLEIDHLLKSDINALSVGQQQRIAAARALIGAPELIIADEPTSALDHDRRRAFLELLFQQVEAVNATILFVSHDPTLQPMFDTSVSLQDINRSSGEPK